MNTKNLTSLNNKYENLIIENDNLKSDIKDLNNLIDTHESNIHILTNKLMIKETSETILDDEIKKNNNLEIIIKDLEDELFLVQKELNEEIKINKNNFDLKSELDILKTENENIKMDNESLRGCIKRLETSETKNNLEIMNLSSENNTLKNNLKDKDLELKDLTKDYNYLLDNNKLLLNENNLARRDIKNNIEDLEIYEKNILKI